MVREGSSPGIWALPAIVIAAGTAVAVALVSAPARTPVAWLGAAAFVAVALACGAAARRDRELAGLRAAVAEQRTALARQEAETVRLAGTLLPDVVARLRRGEFPEDVLASLEAADAYEPGLTPEFRAAHQAVLRSVLDAVVAEEDLRESAQRAFVNIARRVQAIVHQQAQELREMEDRHGQSPSVFGDLLRLDHGTALIGRLADSIAVLGGARPGRQWSRAVPLYSVLRGAMSRIIDYQRVELHSVSEVAVVGPAVEPLIHALAELLDNATRYSPPQTKVHLTAVDVNAGIAIEIEDGGVSMSEEARGRAERMLRQAQQGIDLNDLGETPRLGLAVVGRLSQAYDFQVSLRSSAYGGVRAVLVVPQDLITTTSAATGLAHGIGTSSGPRGALEPAVRETAARPSGPSRPVTGPSTAGTDAPVVTERTPSGLPQRRRKTRVTAEPATTTTTPAPAAATTTTTRTTTTEPDPAPQVQPGMWLAAFQSGLSGERPTGADQNSDASPAPASKGEQP
ncbi:sensor histidine kinase [Streptomyces sp. WAC05374]|uniref:sensor histidine kinase n=1 Tax=Streptomyces sp. WAC05374 TaxID=2487420 RepID=UPI000F873F1F|nr:ATP-binding protein [Streptomyces sp. WAC05374]RST18106.1 sensor histidine kinase [Streptomyces sp. WAC05374]TDF45407.1 sensor histidine kinase [Streptomyces sp. WAC05374]TDF55605.1 sensor histidine kinase [Streptomyces sp. WAC05374]TDF58743.1 sensor histidine kinase [Streptomyces sp. WAC05374]